MGIRQNGHSGNCRPEVAFLAAANHDRQLICLFQKTAAGLAIAAASPMPSRFARFRWPGLVVLLPVGVEDVAGGEHSIESGFAFRSGRAHRE